MEILLRPWKRFADFRGRSSRTEFGLFHLITWILIGLLTFLPMIANALFGPGVPFIIWFLPCMLVTLAALVPSLAVGVRRVNDSGIPGLLYLAMLPLLIIWPLALVIFVVVALIPGKTGDNAYGPDPREPQRGLDEAADRIFG